MLGEIGSRLKVIALAWDRTFPRVSESTWSQWTGSVRLRLGAARPPEAQSRPSPSGAGRSFPRRSVRLQPKTIHSPNTEGMVFTKGWVGGPREQARGSRATTSPSTLAGQQSAYLDLLTCFDHRSKELRPARKAARDSAGTEAMSLGDMPSATN